MSTASTQFEDERRLEYMMQKRHRQAQMDAHIRLAKAASPTTGRNTQGRFRDAVSRAFAMLHRESAPMSPELSPTSPHPQPSRD